MRHRNWEFIALVLIAVPLGCNLDPGTLGNVMGSGGSPSTGAGGGLSTGAGGTGRCGDPAGGGSCGQTTVPIAPLPPDILIVQSKALSMADGWDDQPCQGGCGATSKWSQTLGAVSAIVGDTDSSINWGLAFYGVSSCGTTSTPYVPVGPMSSQAISSAFAANQPATGNPIETAVNDAATYMLTLTDPNPKYLLLVTDGLPDCMPGDTSTTDDDSLGAEAAVVNARMAGVSTFVVGLATSSDVTTTATLDQMADNGGEAQAGATTSYYAAMDSTSLEAALTAVVGTVVSCTLPLTNVPPNLTNIAVAASESSGSLVKIPEDSSDGWSFTNASMNAIILNGTACAQLRSGAYTNFQFIYACDDVEICIDKNG
jgi:von Willebrand factor type A domain